MLILDKERKLLRQKCFDGSPDTAHRKGPIRCKYRKWNKIKTLSAVVAFLLRPCDSSCGCKPIHLLYGRNGFFVKHGHQWLSFPNRNYEHIVKAHQNNPQQGEDQVSDQVKFNIFQSIMDSLFQSFSNSVSVSSFQELSACVFSWIEEHCKPQVRNVPDKLWTPRSSTVKQKIIIMLLITVCMLLVLS